VTAAEEDALRRWAHKREKRAIRAMTGHAKGGMKCEARRLQRAYLWSLSARLANLFKKVPRHLRDRQDLTAAERDERRVRRWAGIIRALPAVGDPTVRHRPRVRLQQKSSGGHRNIFVFTWREAACSRLLSRALAPFADLHPDQYALYMHEDGRGRNVACEALLDKMRASPTDYGMMQIDVCEFFPSINTNWLEAILELPNKIIRSSVHTGGMRIRAGGLPSSLARPQLPQGSVVAPLVAEWVMADVLRAVHERLPDIWIVVYVDNIAILCSQCEASSIEQTIRDVFRTHGAGPFDVRSVIPGSAKWKPLRKETSFLGYNFIRRGRKPVARLPAAPIRADHTGTVSAVHTSTMRS
jgi:hypothetical protein